MARLNPVYRSLLMCLVLGLQLGAPAQPAVSLESTAAQSPRLMVALVFGQSNAANFGASPRTSGPSGL